MKLQNNKIGLMDRWIDGRTVWTPSPSRLFFTWESFLLLVVGRVVEFSTNDWELFNFEGVLQLGGGFIFFKENFHLYLGR